MSEKTLTCIECPIGCEVKVTLENGKPVSVQGNACPRGKMYAESEVVCPMRVLTSTVRTADGRMLPVKTDKPVKKSEMFAVMKKINGVQAALPVRVGDILVKDISDGANLVATENMQ